MRIHEPLNLLLAIILVIILTSGCQLRRQTQEMVADSGDQSHLLMSIPLTKKASLLDGFWIEDGPGGRVFLFDKHQYGELIYTNGQHQGFEWTADDSKIRVNTISNRGLGPWQSHYRIDPTTQDLTLDEDPPFFTTGPRRLHRLSGDVFALRTSSKVPRHNPAPRRP